MGQLREQLGACKEKIHQWRQEGLIVGRICNAKGEWMFDLPEMATLPLTNNKNQASEANSTQTL